MVGWCNEVYQKNWKMKYTDWLSRHKSKNGDVDKTHSYWKHCKSAIALLKVGALNSHAKGKGH